MIQPDAFDTHQRCSDLCYARTEDELPKYFIRQPHHLTTAKIQLWILTKVITQRRFHLLAEQGKCSWRKNSFELHVAIAIELHDRKRVEFVRGVKLSL